MATDAARSSMLFTCRPPGPSHACGKWFTIDIHCHLRSDKAAAMVAGNDAVSRWFLETAANERSQAINRQNGERTHLQGMSAEQRIRSEERRVGKECRSR